MSELKLMHYEASELDETIIEPSKEELEDELVNEGYQGVVKRILLDAYFNGKYYLFSTVQEYVKYAKKAALENNYVMTDLKSNDNMKLWNDLVILATVAPRNTSAEEKVEKDTCIIAWTHAYSGAITTIVDGWAAPYTGPYGNSVGIAWTTYWANAYNPYIVKCFRDEEERFHQYMSSGPPTYGGYN
jgi:hypothetical protein